MGKESYIAPRKSKSGDGFWSISRENMIPTLNEDGKVVVAVSWLFSTAADESAKFPKYWLGSERSRIGRSRRS
jgi:hypothetical protein